MCDENAGVPFNSSRAEKLKQLCQALQLDALLLITGFDGCYNLEAKGLVEWLCDCAALPATDFKAAALEEGLFIAMPHELAFHVIQDEDEDMAAEDAVSALDRLLADPASAPAAAGSTDIDMPDTTTPAAAPAAAAADASSTDVCMHASPMQQTQQQQTQPQQQQHAGPTALDGKMTLLLQLQPRLRRVGIFMGVEVRGGVQQQVPVDSIWRWPLLMAAAEHLHIQPEQLFQEVVDVTHTLRTLLAHVDGTHLSNTLRTRRPLLTRAWLETIGVCGRRSNSPKLDLTEAVVAAPVTEFVSGCGCRLKPGQYQPLALPPRVLFGTRTSQQESLSCPSVSLRSQAAQQGTAVLHATVEAADACSPLRVARTVFFSQGAGAAEMPLQLRLRALQQLEQQQDVDMGSASSPRPAAAAEPAANGTNLGPDGMSRCDSGNTNNSAGSGCCSKQSQQQPRQQQQPSPQQLLQPLPAGQPLSGGDFEADQTDLFDLMCWYWSAVDAAWQCMEFYATHDGATWQSAQALAAQVFWSAASAAQLVPQQLQLQLQQQQQTQQQSQTQPQLQLQLFSWDGGPRPMPSGHHLQQHNHRFKTLRVTVSGIRSRSTAHPGLVLGNVLYMDSFVDVPAVGGRPPRLVNLTLTHCPTYTFDFWGTEAALNTGRVAAFRRHLQIQLQSQLQAEQQAGLHAALRRSADDSAVLRMQLQQGAKQGGRGVLRRASMGQQQQFMLLQQLAASGGNSSGGSSAAAGGSGGSSRASIQAQRQQLLMQLQQGQGHQQKGRGGGSGSSSNGGRQQKEEPALTRGNKHALGAASSSCCGSGPAEATAACGGGSGSEQQAQKRSCCGNSSGGAAAAAAAATPITHDTLLDVLSCTPEGGAAAAAGGAGSSNGSSSSNGGSGSNAAVAAAAVAAAQCWRHLGRLMVPPGEMPGEVALLLTGAMKLAVMDGPLYAHSNGLVFVSRPTKVHVLLLDQIEAVWLQDFASRIPGYPDLGPCIVIKGTQPCCGLLPAAHMTDNPHVAIPLRVMRKVCSQHFVTAVLPAWQAAAGVVKASKGATVPWPLPAEFQPFYGYWVQGPRKRYMLPQPDEEIDQLVQQLDRPLPQRQQQQQHAHPHAQ